MRSKVLASPRKHALGPSVRAFATSAARCDEKPVLNRYSRTVTQPKAQGASQVRVSARRLCVSCSLRRARRRRAHRLCCMLPRASTRTPILTRPWSASRAYGESRRPCPLFSRINSPRARAGTKATREPPLHLPIPLALHPRASQLTAALRCNRHLLGLGQRIKASLSKADLIGYQFGTVGVSDGISMGTRGMSYSLQSRDLIADQVETAAGGHWLDGMVVVPGCDKNMPGVLMARQFPPPPSRPRALAPLTDAPCCARSRPAEPPGRHGVRRDDPPRLVRWRAAARHRLGLPVVREVSPGRPDF